MKKLMNMTVLILLTIALSGCYPLRAERSETPIEMVAFASLTDEEQHLLPASPKDSVVSKVAVTEQIATLMGRPHKGTEVYAVTFNHTETKSSGNLIVYVDLDKKTVVGKGRTSLT